MKPEDEARLEIDEQLAAAGWVVQDLQQMHISAATGIAVREFPLATGHADYLLYVDGKALGAVEAKSKGHTLAGVEVQSLKYLDGLAEDIPVYARPLPFHYESTGVETQFTNRLDPDPRSRRVFAFHRPEELRRLAQLDRQFRQGLRELPELNAHGLWRVQVEAVQAGGVPRREPPEVTDPDGDRLGEDSSRMCHSLQARQARWCTPRVVPCRSEQPREAGS